MLAQAGWRAVAGGGLAVEAEGGADQAEAVHLAEQLAVGGLGIAERLADRVDWAGGDSGRVQRFGPGGGGAFAEAGLEQGDELRPVGDAGGVGGEALVRGPL